jgi:potassium-transporting ATPase potassium-binding subunit
MTAAALTMLAAFVASVWLLAPPIGRWLASLAAGNTEGPLGRIDRIVLNALGPAACSEQRASDYAIALLLFNLLGIGVLFLLQMLQDALPLNPQGFTAPSWHLALNTAVSFATNTNWQAYAGEQTMSHGTQMFGLAVQNFLSAASGIAVAFALMRAFAAHGRKREPATVGNFWADLWRITLWLLLPLSLLLALFFVSQGVVQSLAASTAVTTLEGAQQTLPLGPVASQEAIKMLGTNGGGFFNANSAHPFENPGVLSNWIQMLAVFAIPAGLCLAFGQLVGDRREGVALLAAMSVIFIVAVLVILWAESQGNPHAGALGIDSTASALQSGGNMEGKEARFGIAASSLFAAITTAASCGAVNTMHASLMPLGGAVTMVLMQLGEVVFGGVGSGLYGMLVFALLAVFLAGLMIGRTPEYLGKKIEPREMKWVSLAILVAPLLVLLGSALAVSTDTGRASLLNPGAHGFSEILYAFSSAANNNGSAFAGLNANTPFYNLSLALAMLLGRFGVIVPVLAIAGRLAGKPRVARIGPDGAPTAMPTQGPLFVVLLIATVLGVGALTYVPALALGPLVEQLNLFK